MSIFDALIDSQIFPLAVIAGIMAIYGLITTVLVSNLEIDDTQPPEKPIGDGFLDMLASLLSILIFPFVLFWHVVDSIFSFVFAIMVCSSLLWLVFALLQGQEVANETFHSIFILVQNMLREQFDS